MREGLTPDWNTCSNEISLPMVNKQLLDYISHNLSLGNSEDEITSTLLGIGWKKEDIDEAFVFLASGQDPAKVSENHAGLGRKNRKRTLLIFELIIAVLIFFSVSVVVLAALDQISLPDPKLQEQISFSFMKIPFFPKTPKYILAQSIEVHKKLNRSYVDISFAVDSNAISGYLNQAMGLNRFDLSVKGPADITDPSNPFFSVNLSVTKDLNLDLIVKDQIVYLKINTIPQTLLALVGLDKDKLSPLLNRWIYYDAKPLETNARKSLEDFSKKTAVDAEYQAKALAFLSDPKLLSFVKVSDDKIDTFPTYKFDLLLTKEALDYLQEKIEEEFNTRKEDSTIYGYTQQITPPKLSDSIEDGSVSVWIDKKEYYMRQLKFLAKIKPQPSSYSSFYSSPLSNMANDSVSLSLMMTQKDFGKPVDITIPQDAISMEEATKLFSEAASSNPLVDPVGMLDKSKFTGAWSDMHTLDNALIRFYTLKGKYPESVYEAIKEGELKGTFSESMAFNNVYYLPGRNKDEYLIYTLTADPESKDFPYLTLSGKNGQASTNKYYSQTDLQNLISSFSGKIIPTLTVTIGPTINYSPDLPEKIDLQDSSCKIEKTCGNLVGVDCGAAVDGAYYYAEKDSGKIVEYCGGYCMAPKGKYCKNCPPKEWTCK